MDLRKFSKEKMNVNNEDMIHRNALNQFHLLIKLLILQ